MRLGDILIQQKRVTPEAWARLAEAHPGSTDEQNAERLVAAGHLSPGHLLAARAAAWSLPCVEQVSDAWIDPTLVTRLPVDWARGRGMLPIRRDGRILALIADPTRVEDVHDLALLLGEEVHPLLATAAEIARVVERCYFERREAPAAAPEAGADLDAAARATARSASSEDLLRDAEGAPVIQLVNRILLEAVRARASDIHIEPFEDRVGVRYRIDGMLYEQASPPKRIEAALTSRLKVMARLDIAEKRLPQDGMARVRVGEREFDVRVSTVPIAEGERIVLRLLNRSSTVLGLDELGMSAAMADRFRRMVREPQGIILVTGPTGSGKTTTLYAALREINTARLNVITIEDPIEYRLDSVSQIQVNPRIELTFARCLRHVLRQDPDVILVGETRDLETAEIAVRASLTGHLVFTTLHTNDAGSAAVRMADMGIPAYLLAASLRGVLAQRLVRRLCPHCREAKPCTEEDIRLLGDAARSWSGRTHWVARGCPQCREGYLGRLGVFELFPIGGEMAAALRGGATPEELRDLAVRTGVKTLRQDGLDRVASGDTSLEELVRVMGRAD